MSNGITQQVEVHIMDRSYTIKCPVNQVVELKAAAQSLNTKLDRLRRTHGTKDSKQLLLMAALGFSHDLILCQREHTTAIERVTAVAEQVEEVL